MYFTVILSVDSDGKLNQTGQIDIQNKKKSQTKKITGFQVILFFMSSSFSNLRFHQLVTLLICWTKANLITYVFEQFAPGNPSEVLITSADSRIRIFDGSDIIHKFRGIFPKHHHLLVH